MDTSRFTLRVILGAIFITALLSSLHCSNNAPSLVPIDDISCYVGQLCSFNLYATDEDGDELNFIGQNLPEHAELIQLSSREAVFKWTPLANQAAEGGTAYQVIFYAQDSSGEWDSETVTITVYPGSYSTIRFLSTDKYTFNTWTQSTITKQLLVEANTSAQVFFSLTDPPEGLQIYQGSSEYFSATFTWTPTAEQIAAKTMYQFKVIASNANNQTATQTLSIYLISKEGNENCPTAYPTIIHNQIPDQNTASDYEVIATITDPESEIAWAAVFYETETVADVNSYDVYAEMELGSDGKFHGFIPNLNLPQGQSQTVGYFIFAIDNDDPEGPCNQYSFLPEGEDYFSFIAYSPGESSCTDDSYSGNSSKETARELAPGIYEDLRVCTTTADWFKFNLTQGAKLTATLQHTSANGNISLELYDSTGTAPIASSSTSPADNKSVSIASVSASGTYYLKIYGSNLPAVGNTYDLILSYCSPDAQEENNTFETAKLMSESSLSNLSICGAADADYFKIKDIPGNGTLWAGIDFVSGTDLLGIKMDDAAKNLAFNGVSYTEGTNTIYYGYFYNNSPSLTDAYVQTFGLDSGQNSYNIDFCLNTPNSFYLTAWPPAAGTEWYEVKRRAQPITVDEGYTTQWKICKYGKGSNWYSVVLPTNGSYYFYAHANDGLPASSMNIQVLGSDKNVHALTEHPCEDADHTRAKFKVFKNNGTYYVGIFGMTSSKVNYSLLVSPSGDMCDLW